MFFRWKNKYDKILEKLEKIKRYNRELYILKNKLSIIVTNLKNISIDEKFTEINLYQHENSLYYIAEKRLMLNNSNYNIFYYTYNLSNIDYKPICTLEASVHINYNRIIIKLDNIDSMYENREGHGTKQIQKLIKHSKDIEAIEINGELYKSTPIGLDNLKRFYIKNGFEVDNKYFKMDLTSKN